MAAPHVTAAAALLWSSDLSLTNVDIRQSLQSSALDLGPSGPDDASGYGLIRTKAAYDTLNGTPTAVQIAGFGVTAENSTVLVEWETAAEMDIVGFNLYRAHSAGWRRDVAQQSTGRQPVAGQPLGCQVLFRG